MRVNKIILAGIFILTACYSFALDFQEISKKADFFYPDEAKFALKIESFEEGGAPKLLQYEGYVKGVEKYVVVAMSPAYTKGTAYLRDDETIYIYMKKIDKMNQVSAKSSFNNSTLTQEDILNIKLSKLYKPAGVEKATLDGRECYLLKWEAISKETAYMKIDSYIDAKTFYPVKKEYYSYSNEKIRIMKYSEFEIENNKIKNMRFVMINTVNSKEYSDVTMDKFDYGLKLNNSMFNKNYLKILAR